MKKHIKFKDGNQVWRILISQTDRLIIETRDTDKKEVYFSCYDLVNGRKIFKSHQLDEKYWIGIEDIYNDTILFHRFAKPDMPGHKSIIAFDTNSKQMLWENNEYSFLFLYEEKIYCFTQKFEGRRFYTIDPMTGSLLEDLGDDALAINELKYKADEDKDYSNYLFPELYDESDQFSTDLPEIIQSVDGAKDFSGEIEYIKLNNLILSNFHHKIADDILENKFIVYDIASDKIIHSEILNSAVNSYVPDSFFIYKDNLIILKEKNEVVVYKLDKE